MAVVYPNINHTTAASLILDFVGFLLDDETSFATGQAWTSGSGGTGGASWSIIEARGRDSGTGSPALAIPPTVTTGNGALADINNDAGLSGSLDPWGTNSGWTAGDWIVLQCTGTNPFQLYIEYGSTTTIEYKLMPVAAKGGGDAFTTGGSTATPPTTKFPATSIPSGASATLNLQTVFATSANYSGVGDDRMFALIADPGTSSATFMYIGSVDTTSVAAEDAYPYVIYDDDAQCRWELTDTTAWRRLDPVDETTELTTVGSVQMFSQGSGLRIHREDTGAATGETNLIPIGVAVTQTNYGHFVGFLENVFSVPATLGASGTINDPSANTATGDGVGPNSSGDKNYVYRNNDTATPPNADPGIGLSWDGTTNFP